MGHGFVVHTTCLDVVYCGISGVSRPVVLDCRLASLNWASLRMSSVVGFRFGQANLSVDRNHRKELTRKSQRRPCGCIEGVLVTHAAIFLTKGLSLDLPTRHGHRRSLRSHVSPSIVTSHSVTVCVVCALV